MQRCWPRSELSLQGCPQGSTGSWGGFLAKKPFYFIDTDIKIHDFWLSETPRAREAFEPFPAGVCPTLPTRKLPQLRAQPGFCAVPKDTQRALKLH